MQVVQFDHFGDPAEALQVVDTPDPGARLVAECAIRVPVEATYPLARVREAVAHAAREARGGKVLLAA